NVPAADHRDEHQLDLVVLAEDDALYVLDDAVDPSDEGFVHCRLVTPLQMSSRGLEAAKPPVNEVWVLSNKRRSKGFGSYTVLRRRRFPKRYLPRAARMTWAPRGAAV